MISRSGEPNIPVCARGRFAAGDPSGHLFAVTDDAALSNRGAFEEWMGDPYGVGKAPLDVWLRTLPTDIFRRSKRVYTKENSSPRIFENRWTGRHRGSGTCPRRPCMGFHAKQGTRS